LHGFGLLYSAFTGSWGQILYLSSGESQRLQMRMLRSPLRSCPTRVGLLQLGHTTITFEIATRDSCSAMPPFLFCLALRCFFTSFTPSTSSFPLYEKTASTRRPSFRFLPRPLITFTVSFLWISTLVCITILFSPWLPYSTSGASETIFKN